MERNLTCIICPRGCSLTVTVDGENTKVSGHGCPKGEKYGIDECVNPVRTVTSIIRVDNREDTMVSVKTADPIPKGKIFELMEIIRATKVSAPVYIGDVIIENVFGTSVIATKDIK
ncbi:MAG: DUF1667 domain-containing protein [Clostridia bacterium]|nr:DUF1667 domain-containing protein [Clostridia bacterium]